MHLAESFGLKEEELPSFVPNLQWNQVVGSFFVFLILLFFWDNLGDCVFENARKSLFYFTPAIVTFMLTTAMCWTETYE